MPKLLLIISIFIIGGCDTFYGVTRHAELNQHIDHKCIKYSLESIDGITDIKYDYLGRPPLKDKNMNYPYGVHLYGYKFEDIYSNISILVNEKYIKINESSVRNNRIPRQKDLDKIRTVMDKIEKAVSQYCGVENFPYLVTEKCREVECN